MSSEYIINAFSAGTACSSVPDEFHDFERMDGKKRRKLEEKTETFP